MDLTSLAVVPALTAAQEDQLALLRSTIPERLLRFAEVYLATLDAAHAAQEVGAPGQERNLLSDRRVLMYISAVCGHTRENNAHVRAQVVGMLAQMAVYDPASALGPAGWAPFSEWPPALRMCVEGLELHESGAVKRVKFTRRLDVIKLLLDMTGSIGPALQAKHGRVVYEQEV